MYTRSLRESQITTTQTGDNAMGLHSGVRVNGPSLRDGVRVN